MRRFLMSRGPLRLKRRWPANKITRKALVLSIVFVSFPVFADDAEMQKNIPTKNIIYRGGIVSFLLPADWREEYQPSGGATFYENRADSGTLRLNVISFESKDTPSQAMVLGVFPKGSFETLPGGFPMQYRIEEAEERGEFLQIHRWEIAVPVPPRSARLIIFSHTVLAREASTQTTKAELDFLQQSIRSARFSQEPGVSGNYPQ